METIEKNSSTKTQSDLSVLAFLVEQYGEKVRELVDQTDGSYAKLKYKGEKDEIARMVEKLHFTPLESNTEFLYNGLYYLGSLVHNNVLKNVFEKRKKDIKFLYAAKSPVVGNIRYVVLLNDNTFDTRDQFRSMIFEVHDSRSYAQFVSVDIDFLPDDVSKSDLSLDGLLELELSDDDGRGRTE